MSKKHLTIAILIIMPSLLWAQYELPDRPDWKERVYFGGGLTLALGNTQTAIGISPTVGYMLTPKFSAGVGGSYLYQKINNGAYNYEQNLWGWNLFARYSVLKNIFIYSEYETLYATFDDNSGRPKGRQTFNALYLGAGFFQPIGDKAGFQILALYDVLYDDVNSYNTQPYVIRAGITYSPF